MRWLLDRRVLGAVGTAGLALVTWIAGDMIAVGELRPLDSPASRLWAIVGLFVLWGLIEALLAWRTARTNRKLLDGIVGGGADAGSRSQHEVAELTRRFEDAMGVLKKTRFRGEDGEPRLLHELPWYVFIGAPGSGKTTALINSGLHFVLGGEHGNAIKGVGGTRNCDWWFTAEAVLLDTAGRYTTQDSEQKVDAAAWTGFLDLLKRFRTRQPLSGAIVTLSVFDLLRQSADERERYAVQVAARIRELYDQLGVQFPVYLLVTKMDLLAGFAEFLGELDRELRSQVWGVTFHDLRGKPSTGLGAVFAAEFVQLERRLYGHLLDRLQQVRDQQRRSLVYSFPQEFSSIGQLIAEFVDFAFGSTNGANPLLRGVYFTSGTQEGTPIDRVLGTLARAFHLERKVLPPSLSSGKSYFLTRLLREVMFREAGLAGSDETRERRVRLMALGATAAVAVLSIGVVLLWAVSFFQNRSMIAEVSVRAAKLKQDIGSTAKSDADLAAVVALLNGMRDLPTGYAARQAAVPLTQGFGLYQGDKVGDLAVRSYRNALRDVLLPKIAGLIEDRLRDARSKDEVQKSLNAYLMLYYDQLFDPNALEQSAASVIDVVLASSGKTALREDLRGHLKASLEMRPFEMIRPRNEELIASARRRASAGS